ncbi:sigma-70 family RNA polymerase sigma factor [Leekyejoonella antrihumi]|uniref:Sigma-70 family RNA polymerase sigma factor n=1 Tax=Leekyejoonella antrihumi TaxID=1660198 RepID=A0A563E3X8_9MICO|nr:sigma-70 family RNA polymerase sigma factor [Leekyejoonella antrihumi]TWP37230.1 sigma-70 family RNA polymerase sigma factor [Leekyejoonella antrihumi]
MSFVGYGKPSRSGRDTWSQELLARAQQETDRGRAERLRQRVVLENQALATGVARQFDHKGIEHEDLVQVALVGLVEAVRRYRPSAGHGFTAFAVPTINGELKHHFRDHGWAVRPPRALQELHGRVRRVGADLEQTLHHSPTDGEIAEFLEVSRESVWQARMVDGQYRAASLDAPMQGAAEPSLGETIADVHGDPYDRLVARISLRTALERLERRERVVLRLRFVDNLTQQQIGRRVGVSQVQVSRLLRDVYGELRVTIEDREHCSDYAPAVSGCAVPR